MKFVTALWYLFTIIGILFNTSMAIWMLIWPRGTKGTESYFVIMLYNLLETDSTLQSWVLKNVTAAPGKTEYTTWMSILQSLFYSAAGIHAVIMWVEICKLYTLKRKCAWWSFNVLELVL